MYNAMTRKNQKKKNGKLSFVTSFALNIIITAIIGIVMIHIHIIFTKEDMRFLNCINSFTKNPLLSICSNSCEESSIIF